VLDGQPNRELMLNREVLQSVAPSAATIAAEGDRTVIGGAMLPARD
jgi:hypothetical protein